MEFMYDVPDVLYKYRDWENSYNRRLLTNQELYFASVDQFNDPFDGTIPHRYKSEQLTDERIFLKYYDIAKSNYPDWTEEQIHAHCYEYQKRGYFKDENHLEQFEEYTKKNVNSKFGIVSLSKEQNNFLMWSHYSNSHKGFCIGFHKVLLYKDTQCGFSHMQYEDTLPTLDLFEDTVTHFTKLIGTKSTIWSYENEYRLTKANFARRNAILRTDTIAEIIFGCRMPQPHKFEILKIAECLYPNAKVFESKLSKTKFETELTQIR